MGMIGALYKKEILDILRDKKTILVMILIPLVLYPLLFVGAIYAVSFFAGNQESATYQIAFVDVAEQSAIEAVMEDAEDEYGYLFEVVELSADWQQAIKEKKVDACVLAKEKEGKTAYSIAYLSSVSASSTAADHMLTVLEDYREALRSQKITDGGMDPEQVLYPITAKEMDVASEEENFGSLLGSILPFLLVVSILMGAVYPAIDTTAGEKERGTLETLLTLPITNWQLIMSKFLAVSTVASVSALLNFISVGIIGVFLYQSLSLGGMGNVQVNLVSFVPAVFVMLLCVVAFAMFMSALWLCICIFAKSFKEAQNYVTPLTLVVMLVGYVGFIPDSSLTSTFAVIPVANIVLLVKNIFMFQYSFETLFLVLLSNVVYSFLAVLFMSRMYHSEAVLFGEGGSVKLFERRKNMKPGQMPGIGDACFLLALGVLVLLYVGSVLQAKLGIAGTGVQQLLFLALTVGFAWYMKVDYKKLFSLKKPKITSVIGALFLWGGVYLAMLLLSVPLQSLFPESAAQLEVLNQYFTGQPAWLLTLVVAVLPAVCEEMLFRGFLFCTMKEYWRPAVAVVASGIIFGLYHMSLIKAVTISLLGMALAYSVYRSGSIATSMLMHLCNNGLAVLVTLYPERVYALLPFLKAETLGWGLGLGMGGAALFCILAGVGLLEKK